MSNVFSKSNTGFDDEEIINKMNDEFDLLLKDDLDSYDFKHSPPQYKGVIHDFCMYQILLKYKDDYYQNLNVLSIGPPDFFSEDPEIQNVYNSLIKETVDFPKEINTLEDKLQTKNDGSNDQLAHCIDELESAKKKNNLYMDILIEREKYEKLRSYHGTEH